MNDKVTKIVNDKIIETLKKGAVPWVMPWRSVAPQNLFSHHRYRGTNSILIAISGYQSPYWATFKQISEHGGKVKKGEHGEIIVFWTFIKPKNEPEDSKKRIALLRYYTVFNVVSQTEGLEKYIPTAPEKIEPTLDAKLVHAERLVRDYCFTPGPSIVTGCNKACYAPSLDVINVPAIEDFTSPQAYYGTVFHEMIHSTGQASRCNREEYANGRFGNGDYGREELVAEMGACYLCSETGIDPNIEQSAAYLNSWIKAIEGDPMLVITAGSRAEKAVDFILGAVEEGEEEVEQAS